MVSTKWYLSISLLDRNPKTGTVKLTRLWADEASWSDVKRPLRKGIGVHGPLVSRRFRVNLTVPGETTPAVRFGPRAVEFLGYDPLPEPKSFGQEIWKLRWRLGLTQRALAGHLRINDASVRGWESGRHGAAEGLRGRLKDLLRNPSGGTPDSKRSAGHQSEVTPVRPPEGGECHRSLREKLA